MAFERAVTPTVFQMSHDEGLHPSRRNGESKGVGSYGVFFFFFFFSFLGPQPLHMEVPSLAVESELQLPIYATAIATPDPSRICNPHCSSQQCRILNPLIEARDQIRILIDTMLGS